MVFTLFGCWVPGGGSPKGLVHNLLMHPHAAQRSKSTNLIFVTLWPLTMIVQET